MTLFVSRACRLSAIILLASAFQPYDASAQATGTPAPSSLLTVRTSVPEGGIVHVTDIQGNSVTGVLGGVTRESIELIIKGETRTVPAREVQRIRLRQPDSWVNGAMIGAGIGAIPGIYYLISDPNECAALCPEEYALAGIGAVVGALIDKAITKKVTVYENPSSRRSGGRVAVTPVLTGARRGLQVSVRF